MTLFPLYQQETPELTHYQYILLGNTTEANVIVSYSHLNVGISVFSTNAVGVNEVIT